MNYDEFKEQLFEQVKTEYGDTHKVQLGLLDMINMNQFEGIEIGFGNETFGQVFHLLPLYEQYGQSSDIAGALKAIKDEYQRLDKFPFNKEELENWDFVQPRIKRYVINPASNTRLLESLIHDSYLDLAVVYYVELYTPGQGIFEIKIHYHHLELWGISEDILRETAEKNMADDTFTMQHIFQAMIDIMERELFGVADTDLTKPLDETQLPIYVVTNHHKYKASAVIVDITRLSKFAEQLNSDYFILPASIHELLLVPATVIEPKQLKNMVLDINNTVAQPNEILSDNVYLFDSKQKTVTIVDF